MRHSHVQAGGKKALFRFATGATLLSLGVAILWFVLLHLWRLYSPLHDDLYSLGLPLRYGPLRLHDPWSDALALCSGLLLLIAGARHLCTRQGGAMLVAAATILFLVFAVGLLLAA